MDSTNTTIQTITDKFDRLFDLAVNTTPSNDNGYRLVLGVLFLLAGLSILERFIASRRAERYRDGQEAKADRRYADEQARIAGENRAASERAINEQASREAAREKVIDEQRKNAVELRKQFGAALSPLELRITALESEQREHNDALIILKFKSNIEKPPKEGV